MVQHNLSDPDFTQQLRKKLEGDLPGMDAHLKMAPPQRFDDKSLYLPNATTKIGAVLLLIYPESDGFYFPLILRPENTGVHSGQVALPGGKKDPEDQDVIETSLRETWEEIGVSVPRTNVIGQLSPLYIPPSNFLVHPTIATIDHLPEFAPSPHEVAKLIKINMPDFVENDYRKVQEIQARYMRAKVPCYVLGEHVVWGATAMILSEFLTIMRSLNIS